MCIGTLSLVVKISLEIVRRGYYGVLSSVLHGSQHGINPRKPHELKTKIPNTKARPKIQDRVANNSLPAGGLKTLVEADLSAGVPAGRKVVFLFSLTPPNTECGVASAITPADLELPQGLGFGLGLGWSSWSGPMCKVGNRTQTTGRKFVACPFCIIYGGAQPRGTRVPGSGASSAKNKACVYEARSAPPPTRQTTLPTGSKRLMGDRCTSDFGLMHFAEHRVCYLHMGAHFARPFPFSSLLFSADCC